MNPHTRETIDGLKKLIASAEAGYADLLIHQMEYVQHQFSGAEYEIRMKIFPIARGIMYDEPQPREPEPQLGDVMRLLTP